MVDRVVHPARVAGADDDARDRSLRGDPRLSEPERARPDAEPDGTARGAVSDEPDPFAGLTVEPLALEDADGLWAALSDPQVLAHIVGSPETSLEGVRRRVARVLAGPAAGSSERWLNRTVRFDGVVIGRVEATLHDGIAEIAYLLNPARWGRGYATEATHRLLLELAGMGVSETWAVVDPGNERSIALLRRLGFSAAEPDRPLVTMDPGDLAFVRRLA